MKATLIRLVTRKQIGLAIDEREVAVSQVAMTPIGQIEVVQDRVAYEAEGLAAALEQLLAKHFTRGDLEHAQVNVGLPALRVFFSTRPIQAQNHHASPEVLLHEVLQSPSLNVDDMVVDLIKTRPGLRPLASVVSCRKKYLSAVLATLKSCGVVPSRAEPSPCALLREAGRKHRPPRNSRAYLRVFLGRDQALAVLMAAPDLPLMWRPFALPARGEAGAILATASSLRILGSYCGLEVEVDSVLIHGRPDLGGLAEEVDASPALQGVRVLRHEGPGLDVAAVAAGLTLSPRPGVESFNLVRSLEGRSSFRNLFPWGQAVFQAAVLIMATFWLFARLRDHRAGAEVIRVEDSKYPWAAQISAETLRAEKQKLEKRVVAIRAFVETRINWTSYTHDLADRLPTDLTLTAFHGQYDLEAIGEKAVGKDKKILTLRLNAPIPRTGAMPREIDEFLQILRADPLLKRDFPKVELADLAWKQDSANQAKVDFRVVCQPPKSVHATPAPTR